MHAKEKDLQISSFVEMESQDVLRRRLYYQASHRGMREVDILLSSFAEIYLPTFNSIQLNEFDKLLQMPDRVILDWYLGRNAPPTAEYNGNMVMQLLLSFSLKIKDT